MPTSSGLVRVLGSLVLVATTLGACKKKLESPAPSLSAVQPNLVCGEQLTTPVTLSGDGLTPVPLDTLSGTQVLSIPQVSLTRQSDLFGAASAGAPVVINPDPADRSNHSVRWT